MSMALRQLMLASALSAASAVASEADPCVSHPCVRGTCGPNTARYELAQYFCDCPVGYSGVHCEIQSLVAPCFSSNMVLQSGSDKTSIYGHANSTVPGDTVTVAVTPAAAVDGRGPFKATAAADGSWIVALGKMAVSTAPLTIDVSSKTGAKQTLSNILVGSVFVCSGQSNMALPVSSGYLPLTADEAFAQAKQFPHIRLLNNGHFWPPTPSHPGGTALGMQLGDAPGWQIPSYGNGTSASPGTVANFSAACWFMGTTISAHTPDVPVGLISTDAVRPYSCPYSFDALQTQQPSCHAVFTVLLISHVEEDTLMHCDWMQGGTSIHRWVSQKAAAQCSQITPTSTQSMGPDIGTLFVRHTFSVCPADLSRKGEALLWAATGPFLQGIAEHDNVAQVPMVLPLSKMAVSGFTWCECKQHLCLPALVLVRLKHCSRTVYLHSL